ncbi:uncharacterized protein LOC142232179 [Haematobia irritans]|uniref:uncharacterized protein LOC142232179 n=1 Tax=Haematobia irritans TaxID=7368 RepID=UPI003F500075
MSVDKACCCLCYTSSYDYKLIQSESGECNEAYAVTVKYFDPLLLTEDQTGAVTTPSLTKVLCTECWRHIIEFHEFQLNVLKTRAIICETANKVLPEMVVLPAEDKEFYNEDDFTDNEPMGYDSDNDDIPLKDLFQRNKQKTKHEEKVKVSIAETSPEKIKEIDSENLIPLFGDDKLNWETAKLTYVQETGDDMEGAEYESEMFEMKVEDLSENDNSTEIELKSSLHKRKTSVKESDKNDIEAIKNIKYSRRGRKPKQVSQFKKTVDDEEKTPRKSKPTNKIAKPKDPNKKSYMDKCRENDLFIAQWKPNLDCDLCSTTATNFNALREHFRDVHKTRCYIKCCDRKFFRRCVLMDHISLHINPEIHKCDICGKSSTTKHNLKLHKQVMHGTLNQFECEICHRQFNQKPTLDRHLLTHVIGEKKYFCKECDKGYVLEVQLNSHIKTVHGVDCVCDQCGRTFHGANSLKKHLMDHAGIPKRKYPCDVCGTLLNTNNNLRRHKAAYHHDGSTAYICSLCGKVSSSENALRAHKKRVHEENKKHKCTYCDKAFKRPKDLREHVATHTGIDLYQCPHCPQTFKVSANMHHHRKRVHPIEWEEARKHRLELPKVNIMEVTNQVVL